MDTGPGTALVEAKEGSTPQVKRHAAGMPQEGLAALAGLATNAVKW